VAKNSVRWSAKPAASDFDAALSYLCLVYPTGQAAKHVRALRRARPVTHAAKDILRASALSLLPRDEAHVAADLKRIHKGKSLAPVLLVQGDLNRGIALVVADGYHRICAVSYFDEYAPICCLVAAS
jgi:hypothetical protein